MCNSYSSARRQPPSTPDFSEPLILTLKSRGKSFSFPGCAEGAGREEELESTGETLALEQEYTLPSIWRYIHITVQKMVQLYIKYAEMLTELISRWVRLGVILMIFSWFLFFLSVPRVQY